MGKYNKIRQYILPACGGFVFYFKGVIAAKFQTQQVLEYYHQPLDQLK